jgi:hypothetical protein
MPKARSQFTDCGRWVFCCRHTITCLKKINSRDGSTGPTVASHTRWIFFKRIKKKKNADTSMRDWMRGKEEARRIMNKLFLGVRRITGYSPLCNSIREQRLLVDGRLGRPTHLAIQWAPYYTGRWGSICRQDGIQSRTIFSSSSSSSNHALVYLEQRLKGRGNQGE